MDTLALLHQLDGGKPKTSSCLDIVKYIDVGPADARAGESRFPVFLISLNEFEPAVS